MPITNTLHNKNPKNTIILLIGTFFIKLWINKQKWWNNLKLRYFVVELAQLNIFAICSKADEQPETFHIKNIKLLKDYPGNESRKGSKLWVGLLTNRYQYIYLDFLNGQNCDFRTPNKYLLRPILLTDLPNSEFFKICRIISYWVTFNIYLLDYVPIKVIWSNIFFQFLKFYLGHFFANHPYIYYFENSIQKFVWIQHPQTKKIA